MGSSASNVNSGSFSSIFLRHWDRIIFGSGAIVTIADLPGVFSRYAIEIIVALMLICGSTAAYSIIQRNTSYYLKSFLCLIVSTIVFFFLILFIGKLTNNKENGSIILSIYQSAFRIEDKIDRISEQLDTISEKSPLEVINDVGAGGVPQEGFIIGVKQSNMEVVAAAIKLGAPINTHFSDPNGVLRYYFDTPLSLTGDVYKTMIENGFNERIDCSVEYWAFSLDYFRYTIRNFGVENTEKICNDTINNVFRRYVDFVENSESTEFDFNLTSRSIQRFQKWIDSGMRIEYITHDDTL